MKSWSCFLVCFDLWFLTLLVQCQDSLICLYPPLSTGRSPQGENKSISVWESDGEGKVCLGFGLGIYTRDDPRAVPVRDDAEVGLPAFFLLKLLGPNNNRQICCQKLTLPNVSRKVVFTTGRFFNTKQKEAKVEIRTPA